MITVNVFGDLMPNEALDNRVKLKGDEAVFSKCFFGWLARQDLNVFNLEAPVISDGFPAKKAGPICRGEPGLLSVIARAKMDIATLANNHMMDYGMPGLRGTEEALQKYNIDYVGASTTGGKQAHRISRDVGGLNISIINVAEQEFGVVKVGEAGVQKEDITQLFYWIKEEKKAGAIVLLVIHGGSEYYPLPSPGRRRRARLYADFGADAVIYHHTHVVSAFEH